METYTDAMVLGINTAESWTVPSGCTLLVFGSPDPFYVRKGATAVIPSTEVADGTSPVFAPAARLVTAGDSLSFIAPAATKVTLSCYSYAGG